MLREGKIISGKSGIFIAKNHQADKTLRENFFAAESGDMAVGREGTAFFEENPVGCVSVAMGLQSRSFFRKTGHVIGGA